MLTLLIKDFRLMFSKERSSAKGVIKMIFTALFVLGFVAIEIFLYSALLRKIENFSNAPTSFTLLFLFVISVFMTVSAVLNAKKLFFNEQDIKQLSNHPVENSKMIISKLIFLVIIQYTTSLIFEYPIFVAYATISGVPLIFYYTALFYPLIACIFEIGVGLLLVYPVRMLSEYLKKHVLLEFILSVVLIFGLVIPYSRVLNIFVDLVANNEITLLFTEENMAAIAKFGEYAVPVNFLVDVFLLKKTSSLFAYLGIAGGVFVLGLSITIYTFHRVRNVTTTSKPKKLNFAYKKRSRVYGLVKKEIILLTKNPDYIFSFSGLLIVQPFLLYMITVAMNAIFSSGTFLYYTTLFPNFVALIDVFLVIMVTLIVNSGANQYISMEERTIKNLKTIPVDYRLQLLVKVLLPFTMSTVSLIIAVFALLIGEVITPLTALFAFLLSFVVVLVFDIISLREELNIRHGKPRSSYLSNLFSYVLPLAYIALVMFLSFSGASLIVMYLLGVLLFAVLGLPQILKVKKHMGDWFMELEAIN